MKTRIIKSLIITASFLAAATVGYSQGTVVFANLGTGTAISNSVSLTVLPSGTGFRAALYYMPDGINYSNAANAQIFNNTAQQLGANVVNFISPGQFTGGNRTTTSAGGAPGWFQVRAWSASVGGVSYTSFEQAVASGRSDVFAGKSEILWLLKTGDPANSVPASTLVADGKLKGFYVSPVPEPAAIGLGILGVGALWLLRRRK